MSILTGELAMPTPLVPFVPLPSDTPDAAQVEAPPSLPSTRGRSKDLIKDARFEQFAPWMLEHGVAHTTVGSYTACVAALLKRGVGPEVTEMHLSTLGFSPASLALYIRAWRKWHQFLGIASTRDRPEGLAVAYLCRHAKPRVTLPVFRGATWSQFMRTRIDGKDVFTLAPAPGVLHVWSVGPETTHHIQVLMRAANGGPFPEDPAALERAVERLTDLPIHAG